MPISLSPPVFRALGVTAFVATVAISALLFTSYGTSAISNKSKKGKKDEEEGREEVKDDLHKKEESEGLELGQVAEVAQEEEVEVVVEEEELEEVGKMEVLVQNSSEDVEPSPIHLEAVKELEEEEVLSEVIDLDEEKPSRSWTDLVEEEELEQSFSSQITKSQPQIVVSLKSFLAPLARKPVMAFNLFLILHDYQLPQFLGYLTSTFRLLCPFILCTA